STFIYLIPALSLVVNGVAALFASNMNPDILFTSLNSIIGATGALGGFLNTIEVFSIWQLIISAIGLQIVGRFSKGLAWGVVIGIYVITTGFTMVSAGLASFAGI